MSDTPNSSNTGSRDKDFSDKTQYGMDHRPRTRRRMVEQQRLKDTTLPSSKQLQNLLLEDEDMGL